MNTLGNIFNDIKGCKSSFDLYVYILEFLQQTQIYLSVKDTDLTVETPGNQGSSAELN